MNIKSRKKNSGLALLEVVLAIVILAILASLILPRIVRLTDNKNSKVMIDNIADIGAAAASWKGANTSYTGISMTELTTTTNLLDASWGTGSGVNPVGGNYTAAASGNNLVITSTGLSTGLCEVTKKKLSGNVISAACATGTLTVTMP